MKYKRKKQMVKVNSLPVKIRMLERDLTMKSLAKKLGVAPSYVCDTINGHKTSIPFLNHLAKSLGLKPQDVYEIK